MTKDTYAEIDQETRDALRAYAVEHGGSWKDRLNAEWLNASAPPVLHRLRNTHGPSWLADFNLDALTSYRVGAWWNVNRQAEIDIQARNPEHALEIANEMISNDHEFIGDNKEVINSDGPTNIEIWDEAMTTILAENPSDQERLNRAARQLLDAAKFAVTWFEANGYCGAGAAPDAVLMKAIAAAEPKKKTS